MYKAILAAVICLLSANVKAQRHRSWDHIGMEDVVSKDSVTKKGYTLIFLSKAPDFDGNLKERMINTFFRVYPLEAKKYNKHTLKKVIFLIDPDYKGVAATGGGIVRFNPAWFAKNPGDIDVVTHEVMHLVQAYPGGAGPGWVTEGIADYVRYKLGVDNKGAGWSLPEYSPKQQYTDSYRVTARFFVWIEKHVHKGIVRKIDAAMRSRSYSQSIWKELTGKTVDELWEEYSGNPAI